MAYDTDGPWPPTGRPYKRALSRIEALETIAAEVRKGWWDH